MRKIIITAFIFCNILSVTAQEYASRGGINTDTKEELNMNLVKPMDATSQYNLKNNLLTPEMLFNSGYLQPNLNFNNNIYDLENNYSYMLYSNSNILDGFGGSYEGGGMILYKPFDNLTISLGASAMKYSINGGSYNDFLFNASATYRFNNWLKLQVYGQYSINSQRNAFAGGYYLSPQNCYGAMLMIKVIDKKKYSINMNVGAERMYNPLNKKWETNYRLGPDIRLK